jgi:hypothetical protein
MTEHQWLTLLSALCTITLVCLGIVIRMLATLKTEFCVSIDGIRKELVRAIEKVEQTAIAMEERSSEEHRQIWNRLLHHQHTEDGEVIIPKG